MSKSNIQYLYLLFLLHYSKDNWLRIYLYLFLQNSTMSSFACYFFTSCDFLQNDKFQQALHSLEDILSVYEQILLRKQQSNQDQSPSSDAILGRYSESMVRIDIATLLHNMGIVCLLNGDYDLAIVNFQLAMGTRKEYCGENSIDHLVSYCFPPL